MITPVNYKGKQIILTGAHKTCEQASYEAVKGEEPAAVISTRVTKEAFMKICSVFHRRRIAAEAVFAFIAVAMAAYAILTVGRYDDETPFWLVLFSCIPLGIAVALEIKRRLTTPADALKRREALIGTAEITADIAFYSDELTYHDPAEDDRRYHRGLVVIPYMNFKRIIIDNEVVALIDKANYAVTVMREDFPDWLLEQVKEKCLNARTTDSSVKS